MQEFPILKTVGFDFVTQLFKMLKIALLIIALPASWALTCSQFYDYSTHLVRCRTTCPTGTLQLNNKCLMANQFMQGSEVHLCENGWVNSQHTLCCQHDEFILNHNDNQSCQKCHGFVYGNGRLCCPASSYADFSTPGVASCRPLGTGSCSSLTMREMFKVCCPAGMHYHLQAGRCIQPTTENCDSDKKICCRAAKMLDYINGGYFCVNRCNWAAHDSFYCRKRQCNKGKLAQKINSVHPGQGIIKYLALNNSCCYAWNSGGSCLQSSSDCAQRFSNRGWAVCCGFGEFYNIKSQQCVRSCNGYFVYGFLCVDNDYTIDLRSNTGVPSLIKKGSKCNGKLLPKNFPLCCPRGFYTQGLDGCQLCFGRIYTVASQQICCPYTHTFNQNTKQCQLCKGNIDATGTLCCSYGQYINYNTQGIPSCSQSCSLDNMYQTKYCCQSQTTSCSISSYRPTTCNPAYLVDNSCQICPTLCTISSSLSSRCVASTSTQNQCQPQCQNSYVYQNGQCEACDVSCESCSRSFNSSSCNSCSEGYFRNGQCSICDSNCQTCVNSASNCSSCSEEGQFPVFLNGQCIPQCAYGYFWESVTQNCLACGSPCRQCVSMSNRQCTKCPDFQYLSTTSQGQCINCPNQCSSCFLNSCYKCLSSSKLNPSTHVCGSSCPSGSISVYGPTLAHDVCKQCHLSCNTCTGWEENCLSCRTGNQYLDDFLGYNMCTNCKPPCANCTSSSVCSICLNGFYLNSTTCSPCHPDCLSCYGSSSQQCSACYGSSRLISGSCRKCEGGACINCNGNNNECLSCTTGNSLYKGNCVSYCPLQTYLSSNNCLDCLANCSVCDDGNSCTACSISHPYRYNNSFCLSSCPQGYQSINFICSMLSESNNEPLVDESISPVFMPDPTVASSGTISESVKIADQKIQVLSNGLLSIRTKFSEAIDSGVTGLAFYFYNTQNDKRQKLESSLKQQNNRFLQTGTTELQHQVDGPDSKLSQGAIQTVLTENGQEVEGSSYVSQKGSSAFLQSDYDRDPLSGLQYLGLVFSILVLIAALMAKIKEHFIAEQANTLILHFLNFLQVLYMFKFTSIYPGGMYYFLYGFRISHFLWFPNFFEPEIPGSYTEYPAETVLIPDGNFIRNAGSSISFGLIVFGVMLIALVISYFSYTQKVVEEMPQVRRIARISILLLHTTFMNLLFYGFTYLILSHVSEPEHSTYLNVNVGISILFILLIPLVMIGIGYHYYETYNSDILQYYYSIRECGHFCLIACQAFLFTFSLNKSLNGLFLLGFEAFWLIFNIALYRYGEGDKPKKHPRLIAYSFLLMVAYLFLSLVQQITWVLITVIVCIVIGFIIVECVYQVIGLYYRDVIKYDEQ